MRVRAYLWKIVFGVALGLSSSAFAGPDDYSFEPIRAEVKIDEDTEIAVRLIHKPTGEPVADAVIFARRADMAPDGMPAMTADLEPIPASEKGVYRFKTNLGMAGNWRISLAAKIQGEADTYQSKFGLRVIE